MTASEKEFSKTIKNKVRALVAYLDKNGRSLVYDWRHDTLLAGPKGLFWAEDPDNIPEGYRDVTGVETYAMFTGCRLLPSDSVFYLNTGNQDGYSIDSALCKEPKQVVKATRDPVIARARELAFDIAEYAYKNGHSLYFDYGDDYLCAVKGTLLRNHSLQRYSPTERAFSFTERKFSFSEGERISPERSICVVYSGDNTCPGELIAPVEK